LSTSRRTKLPDAIQLGFAQALVAFFRGGLRLLELFGPQKRRNGLRELREKMEAIDRDKREILVAIARDPHQGLAALDRLRDRYPGLLRRGDIAELRVKRDAVRDESEAMRKIRERAGENSHEAARGYTEYLASHPTSHLGYSCLGSALLKLEDWEASLDAYREAERLAADSPLLADLARLNIGKALHQKGDLDSAAAQFQGIITTPAERDVTIGLAYYYLGNVLNAQGNRADARTAWKAAAKYDRTKTLAPKIKEMLRENP
jgi:tetratricopeptide (TPR) repeat protein